MSPSCYKVGFVFSVESFVSNNGVTLHEAHITSVWIHMRVVLQPEKQIAILEACVAALLCWNAFLNNTGGNRDTGLQSRKGNQLMVLHSIAYIS